MSAHNTPAEEVAAIYPASGRDRFVNGVGFMRAWGPTVPADAGTGYGTGCLFYHTDPAAAEPVLYINVGSRTSCNFDVLVNVDATYGLQIPRSSLQAETKLVNIDLSELKVTGTLAQLGNAAGTPAGALGVTPGTHGTAVPVLKTEAANNNSKTNIGRFLFPLPSEYAGGDMFVKVMALRDGALQVGGTVDIEAFKVGTDGLVSGADICVTAAQTVTASAVEYSFGLSGSGLVAGDMLDIEVTGVANDTGGANGKLVQINRIQMSLVVRG